MSIRFEANEQEINALIQLIDSGVRASGIRGAGTAVQWVMKLEQAVKEAQEPEPEKRKLKPVQ